MAYVEVQFLVNGEIVWNQGREVRDRELQGISDRVANGLGGVALMLQEGGGRRAPGVRDRADLGAGGARRGQYRAVLKKLIEEREGKSVSREEALKHYLDATGIKALNPMQRKGFNNAWRALQRG